MLLSFFANIIIKQLTLPVTWPFDLSQMFYYKWSIVTTRLACLAPLSTYQDGVSATFVIFVGDFHRNFMVS